MMLGLQLGQPITERPDIVELNQVRIAVPSMSRDELCNLHRKLWAERDTLANVRKQQLSVQDRRTVNLRYHQLSSLLSLVRGGLWKFGETMESLKRCEAAGQTFGTPASKPKPEIIDCDPGAPWHLKTSARRWCAPGEGRSCTLKIGPNTCTCCPPQAQTQSGATDNSSADEQQIATLQAQLVQEQAAWTAQQSAWKQQQAESQQQQAQASELSAKPQAMPVYAPSPSFLPGPVTTRMPPTLVSQQKAPTAVPALLKTTVVTKTVVDKKKKNVLVAGIIGAALLLL